MFRPSFAAILDFKPGTTVDTCPVTATGKGTASNCTGIVGQSFTGEATSVGVAEAANPLEDCVNVPVTRVSATFQPIYIVTT